MFKSGGGQDVTMSELAAKLARRRSMNGEEPPSEASATATVAGQAEGGAAKSSEAVQAAGKVSMRRSTADPPAEVEPAVESSVQEEVAVAVVAVEATAALGVDTSILTEGDEEEDEEEKDKEKSLDTNSTGDVQKSDMGEPSAESETEGGIDKDKDIVMIRIADGFLLGVVVAPLVVDSQSCGGLYVLEIPNPAKNIAGFRTHDVLISVNGQDITKMSNGNAAECIKFAKARQFTVVRKRQAAAASPAVTSGVKGNAVGAGAGAGAGAGEERGADKENISCQAGSSSSRSSTRGKRSFQDTQEEGDEVEEDKNTTSSPWKALKKKLAARSGTRPLYAAGHLVPVDTSRVTMPTMLSDMYPSRPSGGGFGLDGDPFVDTLKNMTRRARESAQELQWPGRLD